MNGNEKEGWTGRIGIEQKVKTQDISDTGKNFLQCTTATTGLFLVCNINCCVTNE